MGGVSNLRPLAESTGIDPETDNEIGGLGDSKYASVANAVVSELESISIDDEVTGRLWQVKMKR